MIDLLNLKLRGYVTPEDFKGPDGERIQKALDLAKKEDICRVVLSGTYRAEAPITVPAGMHLVLENALLCGTLQNEVINNWCFEQDRIYIEGKNGRIEGNVNFCHTRHVTLENLQIEGSVTLLVSRDLRIEYTEIGGALTLGRGCQNAIMQHVRCNAVLLDGRDGGYDVMGRERIIKNILLRDADVKCGVQLTAAADCPLLNVQVSEARAEAVGVTVGREGDALPRACYQNLTFTDIDAPTPVHFAAEYLHAYVK